MQYFYGLAIAAGYDGYPLLPAGAILSVQLLETDLLGEKLVVVVIKINIIRYEVRIIGRWFGVVYTWEVILINSTTSYDPQRPCDLFLYVVIRTCMYQVPHSSIAVQ